MTLRFREYDIFVPTVDRQGARHKKKRLALIKKELISYFGGLTDTLHRNEGLWKLGPVTVRDDIILWRVLSDKGRQGDRFILKIRRRLEKELNEKQILVVARRVEVI